MAELGGFSKTEETEYFNPEGIQNGRQPLNQYGGVGRHFERLGSWTFQQYVREKKSVRKPTYVGKERNAFEQICRTKIPESVVKLIILPPTESIAAISTPHKRVDILEMAKRYATKSLVVLSFQSHNSIRYLHRKLLLNKWTPLRSSVVFINFIYNSLQIKTNIL